MHFIRNIIFVGLLLTVASSCLKENIDVTAVEVEPFEPTTVVINNLIQAMMVSATQDGIDLGCFTIELPFSVALSDGSTVAIDSEEQFEALISITGTYITDFVFPLNAHTRDGNPIVLEDAAAMVILFASCVPAYGWSEGDVPAFHLDFDNNCFALVYPVTVKNEANEHFVANGPSALADLIASEPMFFAWPVDLVSPDGAAIAANDAQDMNGLLASCSGSGGTLDSLSYGDVYLYCLRLNYPLTIILPNDSTAYIPNGDTFSSYLFSGLFYGFAFPLTVQTPDGDILQVHSNEELDNLTEDLCDTSGGDPSDLHLLLLGTSDCFSINFPIVVIDAADAALPVEDMDELITLVVDSPCGACDLRLQYPLQVTMLATGDEVTINSAEEIDQLCP